MLDHHAAAPGPEAPLASRSMSERLFELLLAGEDILVLRRLPGLQFHVVGVPPFWTNVVARGAFLPGATVDPPAIFAFLDHFLYDAQPAWDSDDAAPVTSPIWTEARLDGGAISFTATARRLGGIDYLLIRSLGVDFEERRELLQRAREMALAHERLRLEISKKEALLHCLVHDVAGPLTVMSNCFDLLGLEQGLTPSGRELGQLGKSEACRQEAMLQEVLHIFASELSALENFSSDPLKAPDMLACAQSALGQLRPGMTMKDVSCKLIHVPAETASWRVVGHPEQLGRVFHNLLENALRHTPIHSTITLQIADEGPAISAAILDEGAGVDEKVAPTLFQRFRQGERGKGKAGLGLFFCRTTIERWGGKIGYRAGARGGASFWFQLPKPKPA